MARFKLDENMPIEAAGVLRDAGHDAVTVMDQDMGGSDDPSIAAVCRRENRAVVTLDLDFSDIRTYPPADYPGIIVLRVAWHHRDHITNVVRRLAAALKTEPLASRLWIVDETGIRIRGADAS